VNINFELRYFSFVSMVTRHHPWVWVGRATFFCSCFRTEIWHRPFYFERSFFFFSFFWSYYHFGLRPSIELGQWWPPLGLVSFNPINVPFLNTLILLSSGVTVTWCHHCLHINSSKISLLSLFFTLVLGIYFTFLQYIEYSDSFFLYLRFYLWLYLFFGYWVSWFACNSGYYLFICVFISINFWSF